MHNLRVDLRRISSSPTRRLLGNLPRSQIEIEIEIELGTRIGIGIGQIEIEIEIELGTEIGIGIGQRRRRGRYYPVQLAKPRARPKVGTRELTMAITTTTTTIPAAAAGAATAGGAAAAATAMAFGLWAPLTRA
jgi:hypothetical protein